MKNGRGGPAREGGHADRRRGEAHAEDLRCVGNDLATRLRAIGNCGNAGQWVPSVSVCPRLLIAADGGRLVRLSALRRNTGLSGYRRGPSGFSGNTSILKRRGGSPAPGGGPPDPAALSCRREMLLFVPSLRGGRLPPSSRPSAAGTLAACSLAGALCGWGSRRVVASSTKPVPCPTPGEPAWHTNRDVLGRPLGC